MISPSFRGISRHILQGHIDGMEWASYFTSLDWWHWFLFGAALLAVDVFLINVYFLVFFGAGAGLTGLALLVWPTAPVELQLGIWMAASLTFLMAWLFLWRPAMLTRMETRDLAEAGKMIGTSGTIVRAGPGGGVIRFQRPVGGRDIWNFTSSKAVFISGQRATVRGVNPQGQLLLEEPDQPQ